MANWPSHTLRLGRTMGASKLGGRDMFLRIFIKTLCVFALLAFTANARVAVAAESQSQTTALLSSSPTIGVDYPQGRRSRNSTNLAQAGCGLCTNVECCGGASNGWKLCKSDCTSGRKCLQVKTCP